MASAPVRAPLQKNAVDQARALRNDLALRMGAAILAFERSTGFMIENVHLKRPERTDFTGRKRSRLVVELKVILGESQAALGDPDEVGP
jgi:hypothetical protein